jgi:siroheme synthase (precorrin-2 oxidase/ferrochelatase)
MYNNELYNLFKELSVSVTIRTARLRWAGHVRRMDEEALPGRILYVTAIGQRETGRPKIGREEVGKDEKMLRIRSWWSTTMNREEWRRLLREAMTLTEL